MDFGDSWAIKTHGRNVYNQACERSIFKLKIDYKVEREILQAEAEVAYNSNLAKLKNLTYEAQWFWLKTPKSYTESIDKHSEDYLGPFNAYRKAYLKFYYSTSNDYNPYIFEACSNVIGFVKNLITEGTLLSMGVATLITLTLFICVPENIQTAYLKFFIWLPVKKIIIAHIIVDTVWQAYNWYYNKAVSFSAIIIWTKVLISVPIGSYLLLLLTMDHSTQTIDYAKWRYEIARWFNAQASFLSHKLYELYELFSTCMNKSYVSGTYIILWSKANIERFYKWLSSFWS